MTGAHEPQLMTEKTGTSGLSWWVVALVGVIALALGVAIGLVLSSDDDSAAVLTPNGSEVTERQEEMLQLVDDYTAAWRAYNIEAIAASMTPEAELWMPYRRSEAFNLRDGSFEEEVAYYAEFVDQEELFIADMPAVVAGDAVVQVLQVPSMSLRVVQVFSFDERQGELRIEDVIEQGYLLEAEAR